MTTKELRRVWSDTPVSPGSILRHELDARGMSEDELSVQAGCDLSDVSGVVRGDLAVTSEFAMKLESVLGIRAQIWLNLQERYDLTLSRNEEMGNLEA